ncbi:hypothetical protein Q0O37_14100, partial [Staphylococcus aureus]|nr:hypothetical protein [Staphylococcus aureus]
DVPLKKTANDALPLSPAKPERMPLKGLRRSMKVLAVDDNHDSRMVISLFLKKLGHKFETAESGEKAIELLSREHFDIA